METVRIEVKPGAPVRITSVGGDLRLTGCDTARIEAQAGRRGGLRASSRGDSVELSCDGGCLIFLPSDAAVEIGTIGGDGRVTDLTGVLKIDSVGGDLRLRRLGAASVGRVGGDLLAQRLRGDLDVESTGGEARLEKVDGDVRLGSVGGDLRAGGLGGSLHSKVHGDVVAALAAPGGSSSHVRADGDVIVRVPVGASLRADLRAEGEVRVDSSGERTRSGASTTVTLGRGEATLEVAAGGDLLFAETSPGAPADLAGAISSQVEAALQEAQMNLDAAFGEGSFQASDLGERVRRTLERALGGEATRERPSASLETERERELILTMLAERKITADEAEALFRALEASD